MKHLQLFVISAFTMMTAGCHSDSDAVNQPPAADAGPSQTIALPVNQLALQGSGSDPDGSIVAYAWSQVSGPNNAVFTDAASPTSSVTGLVEGTYTFRLTVTDNEGATGSDTTNVRVLPAGTHIVTLQPANNPDERQFGHIGASDHSVSNSPEEVLAAWKVSGDTLVSRSALKFDLSSIPATATVVNATLYLYSDPQPTNGNLVDANAGADNSVLIQRITAPWTSGTTWNEQPATATFNQAVIPHTAQSQLDVAVDVTGLIIDILYTSNNGMLLKLQNETANTSRLFVSSYSPLTGKHPKLVVQYR